MKDHIDASYLQVNELIVDKKLTDAISLLKKMCERFGESYSLLFTLGRCLAAQAAVSKTDDEAQEAVLCFQRASEIQPYNAHIHVSLASVYLHDLKDYAKAISECRKSLEIEPNYVQALITASSMYGLCEDIVSLNEAIAWIEKALQIDSVGSNYLRPRLASLHAEAGQLDKAIAELKLALLEGADRNLCVTTLSEIMKAAF